MRGGGDLGGARTTRWETTIVAMPMMTTMVMMLAAMTSTTGTATTTSMAVSTALTSPIREQREDFERTTGARDSNAVPFPRPLLLLACIIHEVLFSDDFFERETKRDYWRKELELKG